MCIWCGWRDCGILIICVLCGGHFERYLTVVVVVVDIHTNHDPYTQENYARIELVVSPPIVPFRETVIGPVLTQTRWMNAKTHEGCTAQTANKVGSVTLWCAPLPPAVAAWLDSASEELRTAFSMDAAADDYNSSTATASGSGGEGGTGSKDKGKGEGGDDDVSAVDAAATAARSARDTLRELLVEAGEPWKRLAGQVWSLGPRRCGSNILFNNTPQFLSGYVLGLVG